MTDLEKLKSCKTLNDLASLLNYKPSALAYILYKLPNATKYREFTIPKKDGGVRTIKAPQEHLKGLQRRLADLLNGCFEELSCKFKLPLSHGFRKDCSIITNALLHRNRRYAFNLDLQDFFPSINFGRVRGFLISDKNFNLEPKVATIIAQIACHDNQLPQGSPCSPVISNLIGHLLDVKLAQLAKQTECTYSRYADDLTFSTNKKDFPQKVAHNITDSLWEVSSTLNSVISKSGFKINYNKVCMQSKHRRQIVTGLVVNKKVNIKKEYHRTARAMCHSLFANGVFYRNKNQIEQGNSDSVTTTKGTLKQLEGMLSYIYMVKRPHDKRCSQEKRSKPSSIMGLYRHFLFYKHFFEIDKPIFICEGKTDLIYLKCAIQQLHSQYPSLIEKTTQGWNWKVGFLRMSDNLKEVFSIAEGTSGLAALMDMYKKNMAVFKNGKGKKFPVIMLIDNDAGAKQIKQKLKKYDSGKGFHPHFTENLYVVTLPEGADGKEIEIEDLFSKDVLATKVAGKSFNKKSKTDTKTEYSKIIFANKVVKPQQHLIDFSGFRVVLDHLSKLVSSHSQQKIISPHTENKQDQTLVLPSLPVSIPIFTPGP
jgi:RNA-directed DNA polymerase